MEKLCNKRIVSLAKNSKTSTITIHTETHYVLYCTCHSIRDKEVLSSAQAALNHFRGWTVIEGASLFLF